MSHNNKPCSGSCGCNPLKSLQETNPAAYQTILDIADLLVRKSADYSTTDNPFWSFECTSVSAQVDMDSIFRTMIGIKTAREAALVKGESDPTYETLQDTRIDRAAYCILQCAYHLQESMEADV